MGIELDAIIAPVSGGGVLSGVCLVASALKPEIQVIGGEPMGADDAARSLMAGHIIPMDGPKTICDGLTSSWSKLPFDICQKHLDSIVTVSEDEIRAAMRLQWERVKIVTEASASVPLAAAMSEFCPLPPGSKVGLIVTGGNVDLENLPF